MACLRGSHVGNVQPGMESTPAQRTTDSSFVGSHYANLGRSTVQLSKAQQKQQEEEKKRKQEKDDKLKKENARLWKLSAAEREARASGGEWTVVMSDKDRHEVDRIIYWEDEYCRMWEEDEREQQRLKEEHEREWQAACKRYDYDYDNEESCRNCGSCGSGSAAVFGCCSMRCAKDADEEDY